MNAKNLLLFSLLGAALAGGYLLSSGRPMGATSRASAEAREAPVPAPGKTAGEALVTLENAELKVTWRKDDAAIVQALWQKDGSPFFPEPSGAEPWAGLGSAGSGRFAAVRTSTSALGQEVAFTGAQGAEVHYRLPATGHILELVSASAPLQLLPVPATPAQAEGRGRVFTLDQDRIEAVAWMDLVKEPVLSFLGARRKALPGAARSLGMDAGTGPSNRYFAAIWEVADEPARNGGGSPGFTLAPVRGATSGRLYLGPKQESALAAFGKPYVRVLDFGLFGPLGKGLFWALHLLQRWIPNWGWSLVLFSFLLRLALWPFNAKTTLQALRARDLEPHRQAIQAKHEAAGATLESKAEQQKEVMAFYRKNGHNPMGGCLPTLVQMPVFIALYTMLGNVFELRHAPWLGWIGDLSGKDPWFVLPALLGLAMVAQQALAPPAGEAAQRRMMMWIMPGVMLFMFASLPAGLNLYYLVFNLVGMAQTWWLTRTYQPQPVLV